MGATVPRTLGAALVLALVPSIASARQGQGQDQTAASGQPQPIAPPEEKPTSPYADTLFGDWGGIRSGLADNGVTVTLGYKGEFAANVSGGERKAATENGQFALTAAFDTGKIGLDNGTLQSTITFRHGENLDTHAGLNVLQQVQEVYGRGQTWRLTELFYQQALADGHAIMKVGRFPAGDFNTFDCEFQNLTFCGAPAGNITGYYWFNWPVAQWSGWLKLKTDTLYLKLGANEDNRNNLDNAFFISRGGAEGVIVHAEVGWTPTFGGGKLPALLKAGYWHTSGDDPDVLLDINHMPAPITGQPPLIRSGQYGFYVQGQAQLTGEAKRDPASDSFTRTRGLNIFFNFTHNDAATATTLDQESIGLYYNAPFKARAQDQMGFALGRTGYNERTAEALVLADPLVEKPDAEYVAELYYALALSHGLSVRPNLQYIIDPGGYSRATDVVVIGTRFDVNF
jgi:porin